MSWHNIPSAEHPHGQIRLDNLRPKAEDHLSQFAVKFK